MDQAKWMGTAYPHPKHVPEDKWERMMLTREAYEVMVRERSIRDALAPKVGERAPDFVANKLVSEIAQPQDYFQLSEQRGRPIAIVFGSYT